MAETPLPASLRAGLLVVHGPASKPEPLQRLAERIVKAADAEIEQATGIHWEFVTPLPRALDESRTHSVADFLSKAITAMSEGLMDVVIVLTDVPISGQDKTLVYGSHSRTARVAVMSTHRLLEGGDGDAVRKLTDAAVVRNATALFLHLVGHLVGLVHQWQQGDLMASFRYDADRDEPRFTDDQRRRLKAKARKLPGQKVEAAGPLMSFIFHGVSALRNPGEVLRPVLRGRAFKIPLAMTTMLTAALIPVIVLVFTAEIWDVALHLAWRTAIAFALVTIVLGSLYVAIVQNLFFPRKEKETLTEHGAVVNVVVWLCMLQALIGLFVLIFLFVWYIEAYVFPEALMQRWTDLDHPATRSDRVKLAVFVSTLGTLTAALGGGLDKQTVARHLALFSDRA
jgi:predicted Zn-dependent protease